jgi:hypothetical protein
MVAPSNRSAKGRVDPPASVGLLNVKGVPDKKEFAVGLDREEHSEVADENHH